MLFHLISTIDTILFDFFKNKICVRLADDENNQMKLKSFTILELLFSMVIIGVIIGLVYTIILFFDRQMLNFQKENKTINECQLFVTSMQRDLYQATDYTATATQITLISYNRNRILYTISGKYLIRTNSEGAKDSLDIVTGFFSEKKTKNNEMLIIQIKVPLLKDTLSYHYIKKRSKAFIFNEQFLP